MKRLAALACALALAPCAAAFADSADTLQDSTAPPDCHKPILPSSIKPVDDDSGFTEKFDAYQQCIKTYIETQQALSQKHVDAANAAVKDANAYRDKVNQYRANKPQ